MTDSAAKSSNRTHIVKSISIRPADLRRIEKVAAAEGRSLSSHFVWCALKEIQTRELDSRKR